MTERVASVDGVLEFLRVLDIQQLKWDLKKLQEIRDWAVTQIGVDYQVGDRVAIAGPIRADLGWEPYREALRIGATAVVRQIDFSTHPRPGTWLAYVALDYAWSVTDPGSGIVKRYWKGRASDTPPGFEVPSQYDQEHYPDGKPKLFMLHVKSVKKHHGAPVLLAPVPDRSR